MKKKFSDKTDERLNLIGFYVCDDEKWFNMLRHLEEI